MKLIHLSDIRLDRSYAAAGLPPEQCNACREELRNSLERILRRALTWPADAVLISGNMLESIRYMPDTLRWLKNQLGGLGRIPVLIVAGEVDPITEDAPYNRGVWPDNVRFFMDRWSVFNHPHVPLDIAGCSITGAEAPLPEFPINSWGDSNRCRVVLAHTPVPDGDSGYLPLSLQNASGKTNYFALGYTNAPCSIKTMEQGVVGISGSVQGAQFDETGVHHYIEVTVDMESGILVTPRLVPTDALVFHVCTLECDESMSADDLYEKLVLLMHRTSYLLDRLVVRVLLSGTLSLKVRGVLPEIQIALSEELQYIEVVDDTQPLTFFNELSSSNTTLGIFLRQINHEILDVPDQRRRRVLMRAREAGWIAFHPETPFPANGVEEDLL